jgi:hypothetical protein
MRQGWSAQSDLTAEGSVARSEPLDECGSLRFAQHKPARTRDHGLLLRSSIGALLKASKRQFCAY